MKPKYWQKYIRKLGDKALHIVAFDVPFPADYGGAIDIFYRVKALHELGVKIHLHCYEYGRGEAEELEKITENVYYYPRKKRLIDWFNRLPFIVQTRRSTALINRLLKDDSPILFEGLHSCFFLSDERLSKRTKLVRTHNIEHHYYGFLAANSRGMKSSFYKSEATKLKRYEAILNHADHILAISSTDLSHFSKYTSKTHLLPPCTDKTDSFSQNSTDFYVLFHGNLSVPENHFSAKWLAERIFPIGKARLIIAGKNPDSKLVNLQSDLIEIIANPSNEKMTALISGARVHALHTDQSTGVKLKLIQSLQTSGHVVVNPKMVEGTDLGKYCTIVNSIDTWKAAIMSSLAEEISEDEFSKRRTLFIEELNAVKNCKVVVRLIDDGQ